jgi:AAA domain, putative AbiEii toxin, Type IV TA system
MKIAVSGEYGSLKPGFELELPADGYIAVCGQNNVGKSTLLQFTFKMLMESTHFGYDAATLFLPERAYVQQSLEPGGRALATFNNEMYNQLSGQPVGFHDRQGPNSNEQMRVLLNHTSLLRQAGELNEHLVRLGFPPFELRDAQVVNFPEAPLIRQGTGLRSVLGILAALTDERIRVILVDEPEVALEPRVQKALRDLLIEQSSTRLILCATHSHLFLHRLSAQSNWRLTRSDDGSPAVQKMDSFSDLVDLTFDLLGSDTQDLFFPFNYLIVEGASESLICERVTQILGIEHGRIKVVAAGGIANVGNRLSAVEDSLIPLVVSDSPYKARVVALIDKPNSNENGIALRLREGLNDRLIVCDQTSLEEQLPESLYHEAGRDKTADLLRLADLRKDRKASNTLKREIAEALATKMNRDHLDDPAMWPYRDAVAKAADTNIAATGC